MSEQPESAHCLFSPPLIGWGGRGGVGEGERSGVPKKAGLTVKCLPLRLAGRRSGYGLY